MSTQRFDEMDDPEFAAAMVPTEADMVTAGGWLVAVKRLDPVSMAAIFNDATERGRLFQVFIAVGETTVRALNLRDDPEALNAMLADINQHALKAAQDDIDKQQEGDPA